MPEEITIGNLTHDLDARPTRCGIHGYPISDGKCFACDEARELASAARRYVAMIEADMLTPGEIGDGYTYATARDRVESFMLAGNGPTVWARFVLRRREIVSAYVEYSSAGRSALHPIPDYKATDLLRVLRADAAAQR